MKFGIGQPIKRLEDYKFLTGNATYNDDINFEDQVYMHLVRFLRLCKYKSINYQKVKEYKGY